MPGSTPIYGFPYPLGTDPVRDGDNVIQNLATDVENTISDPLQIHQGLRLLDTASFNGGTFAQLDGFSMTYQQYLVVIDDLRLDPSAPYPGSNLTFAFTAGGVPNTTANYRYNLSSRAIDGTATLTALQDYHEITWQFPFAGNYSKPGYSSTRMTIKHPARSDAYTRWMVENDSTEYNNDQWFWDSPGVFLQNIAFDGIRLYGSDPTNGKAALYAYVGS